MRRVGVSVKSLILLGLLVCAVSLTGCSISSGCKDTEVQSSRSPDGLTTASVTVANCGATADFFSYVSIKTDQVRLRDKGVLFAYRGNPKLTLTWRGQKDLRIDCSSGCMETKIYRE